MLEKKPGKNEENCVEGTGEFQLKGIYVTATVEVQGGLVKNIHFTDNRGESIPEAVRMLETLRGKSLHHALKFTAENNNAFAEAEQELIVVTLLEAFHRALEACVDKIENE